MLKLLVLAGAGFTHQHQGFKLLTTMANHCAPAVLAPDQAQLADPGPGADPIRTKAPVTF